MNLYYKLVFFVLLSFLLAAQEKSSMHILQNASLNRTNLLHDLKSSKKDGFEFLSNNFRNHQFSAYSVPKQKLDSIASAFVNDPSVRTKEYISYTKSGKELVHSFTEWNDSAKTYFNSAKIEKIYDNIENLTNQINYTGSGLSWINSSKSELTYNLDDNPVSNIRYDWNLNTKQWELSAKDESSYNTDKKLILNIHSNWNLNKKLWELASKNEISYDTHGNIIAVTGSEWNAIKNQWINSDKTEIENDTNGNIISQTFYKWDNQWLFLAKDEFTYNTSNKELTYVTLYWDEINADWVNDHKWTSTYNSNQYLTNFSEFDWYEAGSKWLNLQKTDYNYDTNNNMTSSINYNWDEQTQKWNPFFKDECSYNNQYAFDELLLPDNTGLNDEIYFHHMLSKIVYYQYSKGTWHNDENVELYYSGINITKTADQLATDTHIVPNPASNYFRISGNEAKSMDFKLFDINGILKISKKIYSNEAVSTESLTKGLFLYQIILNNKTLYTGKLILN